MSKPIATIGRHRYGIGHTVVMGEAAIIHVAEKADAETVAAVINAAFADLQSQRDELLVACEKALSLWDRYIDRTGANEPWAVAVRDGLRAAIARARGEVGS